MEKRKANILTLANNKFADDLRALVIEAPAVHVPGDDEWENKGRLPKQLRSIWLLWSKYQEEKRRGDELTQAVTIATMQLAFDILQHNLGTKLAITTPQEFADLIIDEHWSIWQKKSKNPERRVKAPAKNSAKIRSTGW
jgi:hypothetical protein